MRSRAKAASPCVGAGGEEGEKKSGAAGLLDYTEHTIGKAKDSFESSTRLGLVIQLGCFARALSLSTYRFSCAMTQGVGARKRKSKNKQATTITITNNFQIFGPDKQQASQPTTTTTTKIKLGPGWKSFCCKETRALSSQQVVWSQAGGAEPKEKKRKEKKRKEKKRKENSPGLLGRGCWREARENAQASTSLPQSFYFVFFSSDFFSFVLFALISIV